MAIDDYRIHAWTRTELIRLWVDLSALEYGVLNGVVYLRGSLRRHPTCGLGALPTTNGNGNGNGSTSEVCLLAEDVERVMQGLPGAREVVLQFDNVVRNGVGWRES